jgi:hypothetical protein
MFELLHLGIITAILGRSCSLHVFASAVVNHGQAKGSSEAGYHDVCVRSNPRRWRVAQSALQHECDNWRADPDLSPAPALNFTSIHFTPFAGFGLSCLDISPVRKHGTIQDHVEVLSRAVCHFLLCRRWVLRNMSPASTVRLLPYESSSI